MKRDRRIFKMMRLSLFCAGGGWSGHGMPAQWTKGMDGEQGLADINARPRDEAEEAGLEVFTP